MRSRGWPFRILAMFSALLARGGDEPSNVPVPSSSRTSDEAVLLQDLPIVEAAALRLQTLREAPANVTVITAAEIQRYGYRTLAEVLDSVRGFYVTYDHMYRFVGVRGLSLPGDFNTRFLVMLNGHPLTDNIYNSNGLFGQDFGLDIDLVERIEIIRGPTSALYGSNGILANINIITRSPVDENPFRVAIEGGSYGEKKAGFATAHHLGKGANLLVSASVFHTAGHSMFLPGYGPGGEGAVADAMDAENGFHSFVQLIWGNWSITSFFNSRRILQPFGIYESLFGDSGNSVLDGRNFVAADYTRQAGGSGRVRWRTAYDQYRYRDVFLHEDRESGGVFDARYDNWGDWLTSQLTYSRPFLRAGQVTVGGELYGELRNLQVLYQSQPVFEEQLRISRPNRGGAAFAQQEMGLSRRWKAYAGLRLDRSVNFQTSLSPRLALVFERDGASTYKFIYARAFRNPSVFEKYNEDPFYQQRSPNLRPENTHVFEVSGERRLSPGISAVVNAFHYRMERFIQAEEAEDGRIQYRNAALLGLTGVETEISATAAGKFELTGSAALQAGRDQTRGVPLVNSPRTLGKVRAGVPLFGQRVTASVALRAWSGRKTQSQEELPGVVLVDLTLTTNRLHRSFDLACGFRNLANRRYEDPVDLTLERIRANGRTFFVKLMWRWPE